MAGKGESRADGARGIGRKGVAKYEDREGDASLAKHVALVWPHDREAIHASTFELRGKDGRACSVGIGFYDGDKFDIAQVAFQCRNIGSGGSKVDFYPGVLVLRDLCETFVGECQLCQVFTHPFRGTVRAVALCGPAPSIQDVLRARNRMAWFVAPLLSAGALSGCFWDGDEEPGPTQTVEPIQSPTPTVAGSPTPSATSTPVATAPSAELATAQGFYREGRFGEARNAFQRLAGQAGDSAVKTEALLGAGKSAFELNDERAGFEAIEDAVKLAPEGSEAAIRAGYLYLKHLNEAERFADGAAFFRLDPNRAEGSTIDSYFRHEGGRALAASGELVDAEAVWTPLLQSQFTSSALKTEIYQQQAHRARVAGDGARLVSALDGLIAVSQGPSARYERATLALDAGDSALFAELLRTVIAKNPSSRYALLAMNSLEENGYEVNPGDAGLVYYRRGLYSQAEAVLLPAIETAPNADDVAFRAFYLAASYEDSGEPANAVRYYDVAAGSGSATPYVHRAAYWAARVLESMGRATEASRRYVALVNAPTGEFTQEAAFRAGYVLYESGQAQAALTTWAGMGAGSARLEYWRGRALEEAGDAANARVAFQRAVDLGPLDLHGMEAARELGTGAALDVRYKARNLEQPINWANIASWVSNIAGGGAPGTPPTAACELMAAGLRDEAEAEIWAAGDDSVWRTFETMRESSNCGLTNVAAQLAVRLRGKLGAASHEPPRDLLRVSYPVDYAATLANEARKANVDPLFFASLIRQESFWDPEALSPADAYGLTQVIPPTGEAIAATIGVIAFEPTDLFRPALSLEFGANYLGGQIARYGNPLIALSAYNAGPGNASRWAALEAASAADLVEAIDFVETRNYVTYIYEAFAHYRLAWGD